MQSLSQQEAGSPPASPGEAPQRVRPAGMSGARRDCPYLARQPPCLANSPTGCLASGASGLARPAPKRAPSPAGQRSQKTPALPLRYPHTDYNQRSLQTIKTQQDWNNKFQKG